MIFSLKQVGAIGAAATLFTDFTYAQPKGDPNSLTGNLKIPPVAVPNTDFDVLLPSDLAAGKADVKIAPNFKVPIMEGPTTSGSDIEQAITNRGKKYRYYHEPLTIVDATNSATLKMSARKDGGIEVRMRLLLTSPDFQNVCKERLLLQDQTTFGGYGPVEIDAIKVLPWPVRSASIYCIRKSGPEVLATTDLFVKKGSEDTEFRLFFPIRNDFEQFKTLLDAGEIEFEVHYSYSSQRVAVTAQSARLLGDALTLIQENIRHDMEKGLLSQEQSLRYAKALRGALKMYETSSGFDNGGQVNPFPTTLIDQLVGNLFAPMVQDLSRPADREAVNKNAALRETMAANAQALTELRRSSRSTNSTVTTTTSDETLTRDGSSSSLGLGAGASYGPFGVNLASQFGDETESMRKQLTSTANQIGVLFKWDEQQQQYVPQKVLLFDGSTASKSTHFMVDAFHATRLGGQRGVLSVVTDPSIVDAEKYKSWLETAVHEIGTRPRSSDMTEVAKTGAIGIKLLNAARTQLSEVENELIILRHSVAALATEARAHSYQLARAGELAEAIADKREWKTVAELCERGSAKRAYLSPAAVGSNTNRIFALAIDPTILTDGYAADFASRAEELQVRWTSLEQEPIRTKLDLEERQSLQTKIRSLVDEGLRGAAALTTLTYAYRPLDSVLRVSLDRAEIERHAETQLQLIRKLEDERVNATRRLMIEAGELTTQVCQALAQKRKPGVWLNRFWGESRLPTTEWDTTPQGGAPVKRFLDIAAILGKAPAQLLHELGIESSPSAQASSELGDINVLAH